ncbi:MAG: hypothetical protein M1828_003835 [Chrysothrix sp. TS-e1954]|nr:MAG: hypothetical protein M1828_003835 [Chrysothrix sp. TS-e1954]
MAPLKILICGGGCAGPALAYWLAGSGHKVTICERQDALRATGAQIDLRAQGIQVAKRMGLLDTIRGKLVDEAGVAFINSEGKVLGTIFANKTGKGAQGPTSEYEIMRGDFVRILYDATKDHVKYIFGKTVEHFEQDEKQVMVQFSDGPSDSFDILVGADGQGSRIRKAMMPSNAPDPYWRLGIYMAYYFIPRTDDDSNIRRTYHAPGRRMIFRRSHNPTETQVYFILNDDSKNLQSMPKASTEQQKSFWTQRFGDAGWQTPRFIEGMKTTRNWYCQEVVQVRTDTWSHGRVVLLGDAAHCASPFSGMGTTGSLVGAYVLAGEINRDPDDLTQAFAKYDETLRPFVNEMQKINPAFLRLAMPETWWGIWILHLIAQFFCLLRLPQLKARFSKEETGGWKLPNYSNLKMYTRS